MELLREHVGRTVMESKQSQFWNAVSVAVFTVLAGIIDRVRSTSNCHKITRLNFRGLMKGGEITNGTF
jgi:hypothetical protein